MIGIIILLFVPWMWNKYFFYSFSNRQFFYIFCLLNKVFFCGFIKSFISFWLSFLSIVFCVSINLFLSTFLYLWFLNFLQIRKRFLIKLITLLHFLLNNVFVGVVLIFYKMNVNYLVWLVRDFSNVWSLLLFFFFFIFLWWVEYFVFNLFNDLLHSLFYSLSDLFLRLRN